MAEKTKIMHTIDDVMWDVLEKLSKRDVTSAEEISLIEKAIDVVSKIDCMQNKPHGYSEKMFHMPTISYDQGSSYARGRDSRTGRYVSRDDGYEVNRSHPGEGYSGHSLKDRAIAKIEGMIDEFPGEYERDVLMRIIRQIEQSE